jgi:predicted bacteriocin transport accessory protein
MLLAICSIISFVIGIQVGKSQAEKSSQTSSQASTDTTDDTGTATETQAVLATATSTDELSSWLADGGTGFLYVGRPTCSYCKEFVPLLNNVITNGGYDNVYYYNIDDAQTDDSTASTELLDQLNVQGTPTFIFVSEGVELERLDDTTSQTAIEQFMAKHK